MMRQTGGLHVGFKFIGVALTSQGKSAWTKHLNLHSVEGPASRRQNQYVVAGGGTVPIDREFALAIKFQDGPTLSDFNLQPFQSLPFHFLQLLPAQLL